MMCSPKFGCVFKPFYKNVPPRFQQNIFTRQAATHGHPTIKHKIELCMVRVYFLEIKYVCLQVAVHLQINMCSAAAVVSALQIFSSRGRKRGMTTPIFLKQRCGEGPDHPKTSTPTQPSTATSTPHRNKTGHPETVFTTTECR